MSTLAINRVILGQFSDWWYSLRLLSLSISFSLFLLPKSSLFPHTTKSILEKRWSRTHSPLDHYEIWEPGSELISKHSHRWELQKYVGAERNTLCIIAFSFPIETQNCFSKTIIPDSLTVELLWNVAMWFVIHFRTSSPFKFSKYSLWKDKYSSHVDNGMKVSIPSPSF